MASSRLKLAQRLAKLECDLARYELSATGAQYRQTEAELAMASHFADWAESGAGQGLAASSGSGVLAGLSWKLLGVQLQALARADQTQAAALANYQQRQTKLNGISRLVARRDAQEEKAHSRRQMADLIEAVTRNQDERP